MINPRIQNTLAIFALTLLIGTILQCSRTSTTIENRSVAISISDTLVRPGMETSLSIIAMQGSHELVHVLAHIDLSSHRDTITSNSPLYISWEAVDTGTHQIHLTGYWADGYQQALDSIQVRVQSCNTSITLPADQTLLWHDTLRVVTQRANNCGILQSYRFQLKHTNKIFIDSQLTSLYRHSFSARDIGVWELTAQAFDAQGLPATLIDSMSISVLPDFPVISLSGDTLVAAGTSLAISANITSAGNEHLEFIWSRNGGSTWQDTTRSGILTLTTTPADSGRREILGFARDSTLGSVSNIDTLDIRIVPCLPVIALGNDTFIDINKTIRLPMAIHHADIPLSRYIWIISGRTDTLQTTQPSIDITFPLAEAGNRMVRAYAIDTRGLASATDSQTVTIFTRPPHLAVPHDTMLSYRDTLRFSVSAFDTNGTIVRYLWGRNNLIWQDSTLDSTYSIAYTGNSHIVLRAGVRDTDGQLAVDSFTVHFNTAPIIASALLPRDSILTRLATGSFNNNPVRFSFFATDADNDSLKYTLRLGTNAAILPIVDSNRTGMFTRPHADTGYYYWQVTITDSFGNTTTRSGEFSVLLQKTICFAGHSIMAGMPGDGINYRKGGARLTILDTLRARASRYERWQPVGPLLTGYIDNKRDDSCLSLSGSSAGNTNSMLNQSTPDLKPDVWTLLTGVNSGFTTAELNATLACLQSMHDKNPSSAIYVCGGMPLPEGYYQMYFEPIFNQTLKDTAESKALQGWNINYVDIYSPFLGTAGDPRYDLMPDNLHPNASGYDTLARTMLRVMGY